MDGDRPMTDSCLDDLTFTLDGVDRGICRSGACLGAVLVLKDRRELVMEGIGSLEPRLLFSLSRAGSAGTQASPSTRP